MFWMSYFGHLSDLTAAGAAADAREQRLATIIGALFVLTIVGLVLGLVGRSKRA